MGLVRTVGPAADPITLDEVRSYLRLPTDLIDDDAQLRSFIRSAVSVCERVSGLSLVTQTWEVTLDSFADQLNGARYDPRYGRMNLFGSLGWYVRLAAPPIQAISSFQYVDTNGVTQTLAPSLYQLDLKAQPGRVLPAYGVPWPVTRSIVNAITITYTAGFGDTGDSVPDDIKDALKNYVSYRNMYRAEPDDDFLDRLFIRFDYGAYR